MKVLIIYYSTYGNVYKMAKLVAEGVKEVKGAEPVIRTVRELIPENVIESREDMKAGKEGDAERRSSRYVRRFQGGWGYRFWDTNKVWECICTTKKPD
ncbi:MAG: hypothetical protein HND38_14115 [Planctomycetes bacterium]|nr:hypothetical protein [Planctomycetota bacterium]